MALSEIKHGLLQLALYGIRTDKIPIMAHTTRENTKLHAKI
jgi:hypothetical protein